MSRTGLPELRVGLVLDWVHGPDVDPRQQFDEHVALLETGRAFGLDLMTSGQHFLPDGLRFYQPIPYLASLASAFPDMRLGTAILLLPLLHPVEVAEQVATLDAISGGRVVCGLGLGYTDREFEIFGIDRRERTARFEESVAILRALWAGGEVEHHGRFFDVPASQSIVSPVQRPGPPIWIAGGTSPSADRAARIGDAFYPPPFVDHAQLRVLQTEYRRKRDQLGRGAPSSVPIRRDMYIAETPSAAAARIEPFVSGRSRTYLTWGMGKEGASVAGMAAENEETLSRRLLLGSPEEIAAGLNALRRDVGMTDFVLRVQWPGMPVEESIRQMELFGAEVLPLVD
ncbi:LLM class flavin-dependent oxidoreductase [Blastococcus sp. CT_GayMR20]|uniref:LLM class flavin-dependent oxidoreductase n=1 Tax=Blastococcus sp. CT_GayMR20 TaxID=2559609 RepID=UPI001073BA04|nr:LLM class flavin-dependent oxidoreductase [Blastococcus sp. CT_GayMR20]TFV93764.1 LLM class flavin-dependent oxidoreductase [Blastococcus sp. CT_GayMR20]TFV93831.1 LLM class flavin-dependent oxidoreductase [Blastococcus sp. CT_GayMR20]